MIQNTCTTMRNILRCITPAEDETVDSTKAEIEALRLAAKLLKQVIRYRRLDATAVQEDFPNAAEIDVRGKVV